MEIPRGNVTDSPQIARIWVTARALPANVAEFPCELFAMITLSAVASHSTGYDLDHGKYSFGSRVPVGGLIILYEVIGDVDGLGLLFALYKGSDGPIGN
jgi:hypothetical protein